MGPGNTNVTELHFTSLRLIWSQSVAILCLVHTNVRVRGFFLFSARAWKLGAAPNGCARTHTHVFPRMRMLVCTKHLIWCERPFTVLCTQQIQVNFLCCILQRCDEIDPKLLGAIFIFISYCQRKTLLYITSIAWCSSGSRNLWVEGQKHEV